MASCLIHYRGLALLVRSYRSVFALRQRRSYSSSITPSLNGIHSQ